MNIPVAKLLSGPMCWQFLESKQQFLTARSLCLSHGIPDPTSSPPKPLLLPLLMPPRRSLQVATPISSLPLSAPAPGLRRDNKPTMSHAIPSCVGYLMVSRPGTIVIARAQTSKGERNRHHLVMQFYLYV